VGFSFMNHGKEHVEDHAGGPPAGGPLRPTPHQGTRTSLSAVSDKARLSEFRGALRRGRRGRLEAAFGICPLTASRRCPFTAISSRKALPAGDTTTLPLPSSTGTSAAPDHASRSPVPEHPRSLSRAPQRSISTPRRRSPSAPWCTSAASPPVRRAAVLLRPGFVRPPGRLSVPRRTGVSGVV
jgi:hypothetical protein